ncbi:MAG: hypothetical protein JST00_23520 [Deltaproteobacteria bacterium]|nr:hypothetical protein [Deltaproteobacteria bacterium]
MPTFSFPRRIAALAALAVALFAGGRASAEDAKTTATANALLADSGSYIPPKTAPQPTPTVGAPAAPKPAPAKAAKPQPHAKGHAHGKAHPHGKAPASHGKAHKPNPNARVKAKAPKRDKASSSRKI